VPKHTWLEDCEERSRKPLTQVPVLRLSPNHPKVIGQDGNPMKPTKRHACTEWGLACAPATSPHPQHKPSIPCSRPLDNYLRRGRLVHLTAIRERLSPPPSWVRLSIASRDALQRLIKLISPDVESLPIG